MDFWVITAIILGGIIFLFLIYGLLQPRKWEVSESATINSTPELLFPYLNRIRNWEEWTIWNRESNQQFEFEYEGPEEGEGATQLWKARKRKGSTKITGGVFNKRIDYTFSFGVGQHRMSGFLELLPVEQQCKVTWTMKGDAGDSPAGRIMAKMMKPYMQKDLQRSLERLRKMYDKAQ